MIRLEDIKIEAPIELSVIISVKTKEKLGEHGLGVIKGYVSDGESYDNIYGLKMEDEIQIKNEKEELLFLGLITKYKLEIGQDIAWGKAEDFN